MTESEWLACPNLQVALYFLRGKASERKARLFACGCCRCVWDKLTDDRCRIAVEAGERYADRTGDWEAALNTAWLQIQDLQRELGLVENTNIDGPSDFVEGGADRPEYLATLLVICSLTRKEWNAATAAAQRVSELANDGSACPQRILSDVFGSPFRPVILDPKWQSPTVASLAQSIYEERQFNRLPLLADALEDAGCTNADILAHCRGPGPHVRGCWALDLLLGKE